MDILQTKLLVLQHRKHKQFSMSHKKYSPKISGSQSKHWNTEASGAIYLLGDQANAVTLAMVLEEGNKEFRYRSCIVLGCNQKFL